MEQPNYILLQACFNHFEDYLQIRSEQKNLFWTGYESAPKYDNFLSWYKERLNDSDRFIYLFYQSNECLGALHIDYYDNYANIGYSVREIHEGKGIATRLVAEAIQLVHIWQEKNKSLTMIKAWINDFNIASQKVVERNGFKKSANCEARLRFGKDEIYCEYVKSV